MSWDSEALRIPATAYAQTLARIILDSMREIDYIKYLVNIFEETTLTSNDTLLKIGQIGQVEFADNRRTGVIAPNDKTFDKIIFTSDREGMVNQLFLYPKTINNGDLETLITATGGFNIVTQLYNRGEKGYQIVLKNSDWKKIETIELNSDDIEAFQESSRGWTIDYNKVTTNELTLVLNNAR